jgi:redox-sensitive bicupin YhaK (pirin superfamily)
MSKLAPTATAEPCVSEPAASPTFEVFPGRLSDLGGLPIRRLLPRSQRRLVGAWCFLDSYAPLSFTSGKPMDVAPHPHMGLQTVSWILEGEVQHNDSLGLAGQAVPGVLNLMTAGRGIAHSEETPAPNRGRLRGVQLWVALPEGAREATPAFEQLGALPVVPLPGGRATLFMGHLAGQRSPTRAFSPIVGAELSGEPGRLLAVPLDSAHEHALVLLQRGCRLDGQPLAIDTLYYLGCGRRELELACEPAPLRALLLGGEPLGETILMWWNFVARTAEETVAARDDWEAGRRFGEAVRRPAAERAALHRAPGGGPVGERLARPGDRRRIRWKHRSNLAVSSASRSDCTTAG